MTLPLLVIGLLLMLLTAWSCIDVAQRRMASVRAAVLLALGGTAGMAGTAYAAWQGGAGEATGFWAAALLLALACLYLPYVLAWLLPGAEPVPLSPAQRLRKGFAPLFAVFGYALGYILCLPLIAVLNRAQEREYDFNFSGWWTEELAAGVYPVGYMKTRAEAGEPPQTVCLRCGNPCYARLTRCVACGAVLPPRPELDLPD